MRFKYCRHCKKDVPMFDNEEYQSLQEVYMQCLEGIIEYRKTNNIPLDEAQKKDLYQPLFALYREISGVEPESNVEEFMQRHYLARWKE